MELRASVVEHSAHEDGLAGISNGDGTRLIHVVEPDAVFERLLFTFLDTGCRGVIIGVEPMVEARSGVIGGIGEIRRIGISIPEKGVAVIEIIVCS
jgi:hypothetical protein